MIYALASLSPPVSEMSALVVVGRGPDWNDMALHRACKRLLGASRIVRACDLSAYVGPEGVRFWHGSGELRRPDACFVRSLGQGSYEQLVARLAILRAMEAQGTLVVNPTWALERVKDKFSTLLALRRAGFLVPKTYLTESASVAYSFCGSMREFVYKPIVGGLGFGSMLFGDRDLAFNIFRLLERQGCPLYVQEFVGRVERELRVIVVAEEVVACVEKVGPPGSWKRNVAQGARMVRARAPSELREMCIRACEKLGLFYAGIDVLESDEDYVALEVNGAPNWRGAQEATGIDIARILVQKIAAFLKR